MAINNSPQQYSETGKQRTSRHTLAWRMLGTRLAEYTKHPLSLTYGGDYSHRSAGRPQKQGDPRSKYGKYRQGDSTVGEVTVFQVQSISIPSVAVEVAVSSVGR